MRIRVEETPTWSIVLAGGDHPTMQPLIREWIGDDVPKQFCTFSGSRSMLQHTYDRLGKLVPRAKTVTVFERRHALHFRRAVRAIPGPSIAVPEGLGRGVEVFLAAMHVFQHDPGATVIVCPADHAVHPEQTFLRHVARAVRVAKHQPDRMIAVAAQPTAAATDLSWIVPNHANGSDPDLSRFGLVEVGAYHRRPRARTARRLYGNGGMWCTGVFVTPVQALWHLGFRVVPDLMKRMETIRKLLFSVERNRMFAADLEQRAVSNILRGADPLELDELLSICHESLLALPLEGVEWSDWGCPDRLAEGLRRIASSREALAASC